MVKLKPCPFCGNSAHVAEICHGFKLTAYTVCCDSLGACIASDPMRYYQTEAEAAEAWNTRHVETCEDTNEKEYDFTCSECGASMYTQIDDCWTMIGAGGLPEHVIKHPNHCPNCGARVVEVER